MSMPRPQIELLVHGAAAAAAAAAGRGRPADDARYRLLAQAYADFRPAGRLDVSGRGEGEEEGEGEETGGRSEGWSEGWTEGQQQPESRGEPLSGAADDRVLSFGSLSFASVWDNVRTPGADTPKALLRPRRVSPDDCIPDSQPEADVRPRPGGQLNVGKDGIEEEEEDDDDDSENGSFRRTRVSASPDLSVGPVERAGLRRQPLSQLSTNSQPSTQSQNESGDCADAKDQGVLRAWEGDDDDDDDDDDDLDRGSCLPSLGLPPQVAGAGGGGDDDDDDSRPSEDAVHIPSSLPEETGKLVIWVDDSSGERPSAQKSPQKTQVVVAAAATPRRAKRKAAAVIDISDSEEAETVAKAGGVDTYNALPFPSSSPAPGLRSGGGGGGGGGSAVDTSLRILSPEPPVACTHLDAASFITAPLAKLASDLDLARRYRPVSAAAASAAAAAGACDMPARAPPHAFERGSWRVDTAGWPAAVQQQAWAFLAAFVGERGAAGWSVWCSRDAAPPQRQRWLRLHCFAAAAGHTYLLLYLASQRHVLATGAVWLDGGGAVAITVPPRKGRPPRPPRPRLDG